MMIKMVKGIKLVTKVTISDVMIRFIATKVKDPPRSSIKVKTYIALPDKLPRSGVCQRVVHKVWHWIQRFRHIAGDGRMI